MSALDTANYTRRRCRSFDEASQDIARDRFREFLEAMLARQAKRDTEEAKS